MKVAVIASDFPPACELRIAEWAAMLKHGVDLRVYHLSPWQANRILPQSATVLANRNYHIPNAGLKALGALRRQRDLAAQSIRAILKQADDSFALARRFSVVPAALAIAEELRVWGVDHIHATEEDVAYIAAWICGQATGLPYSVTWDGGPASFEALGREAVFVRTTIEADGPPDASFVPLGIDLAGLPASLGHRETGFRVLVATDLTSKAGLDQVLRALASFTRPDWCATFVGDGPDRSRLERLAETLDLEGRTAFVGAQPECAVERLYRSADVSIVPARSADEGSHLRTAVLQAAARCRPVIAPNQVDFTDILGPGGACWRFDPKSDHMLTAQLIDVFDNPAKARTRAHAARRRVEDMFDLDKTVAQLIDLFACQNSSRLKKAA